MSQIYRQKNDFTVVDYEDSKLTYKDKTISIRTFKPAKNEHKECCLILLHDALGSIAQWKNIPDLLCMSLGMEVVCYDRLNYGKSDATNEARPTDYLQREATEVLPALIQQELPNKKPILMGHSDGATIALAYAGAFTDNPLGVISIAAHSWVEDITISGIEAAEAGMQASNWKEKLEKYHADKAEFLLSGWIDTWKEMKKVDWNIFPFLEKIECPVYALQGDADEYGSEKQLEKIKDLAKGNVQTKLYEGVKHFPHLEQKGMVINDIVHFINSTIFKA